MYLSCFVGNSYIAVTESLWAPEMATILEEEFKPLGKIISVGVKKRIALLGSHSNAPCIGFTSREILTLFS